MTSHGWRGLHKPLTGRHPQIHAHGGLRPRRVLRRHATGVDARDARRLCRQRTSARRGAGKLASSHGPGRGAGSLGQPLEPLCRRTDRVADFHRDCSPGADRRVARAAAVRFLARRSHRGGGHRAGELARAAAVLPRGGILPDARLRRTRAARRGGGRGAGLCDGQPRERGGRRVVQLRPGVVAGPRGAARRARAAQRARGGMAGVAHAKGAEERRHFAPRDVAGRGRGLARVDSAGQAGRIFHSTAVSRATPALSGELALRASGRDRVGRPDELH